MKEPILLISDMHYHAFTQFSTVVDGVNSRLRIAIEATYEAAQTLKSLGGKIILLCGDTFHVRGKLEPSVLNPVADLYRDLTAQGFIIIAIPGNHDLEGNNSSRVSNSVTGLEDAGVVVAHNPRVIQVTADWHIWMFPWFSTVKELCQQMEDAKREPGITYDAIIHAPVDGVLPHLPPHGLGASVLGALGYGRVFAGHYHNHKDLGHGVYSVGALTHQTWGDVGSQAGFMLVYTDRVEQFATAAPRFVDITGEESADDLEGLVFGNFVRLKMETAPGDENVVEEMRSQLMGLGAKGVNINHVKTTVVTRTSTTASTTSGVSIEASIENFVAKNTHSEQVHKLALDVLTEARAAA